jgi:hypothetical protein
MVCMCWEQRAASRADTHRGDSNGLMGKVPVTGRATLYGVCAGAQKQLSTKDADGLGSNAWQPPADLR